MASFKGVFTADYVEIAPCGLLSVVRETRHTRRSNDERWVRGYSYETTANPTSIDLVSVNNPEIPDGNVYDGSAVKDYFDGSPFFVAVSTKVSTFGVNDREWKEEILAQLDEATQKAVERELWDGPVALKAEIAVPYLTKGNGATVLTSGGVNPRKALYLIEQAISNHPTGSRGTIHMTRDVASALGSRLLYKKADDGREFDYAITRLGTDVVIGSGYSGNGPIGAVGAAATVTNKWMFVTGAVDVHLGKGLVDNENLGQGATISTNDLYYKAHRPAAVHFDPSIWHAAQITLPENP